MTTDQPERDPRLELAEIAGLLRAHLEWQQSSGALGLPRAPAADSGVLAARGAAAPLPRSTPPVARGPEAVAAAAPAASARVPVVVPGVVAPAVPVTAVPVTAVPVTAVPVTAVPVTAVPVTAVPVTAVPVTAVPVTAVPANNALLVAGGPSPEVAARLEQLRTSITHCQRCPLHLERTQTVFARGQGSSGLCFVGEGPGADEDSQGLPFVGAAGQLLDRMIQAMGLSRDDVYVCNIVKCRPPKNRKPAPEEMQACRGYLETQIELLTPQVIVALGATAVEGLLGAGEGITRLRGRWKTWKGKIPVMPTFHPAYLLRNPAAKKEVWEDLQKVLTQLGRTVPGRK